MKYTHTLCMVLKKSTAKVNCAIIEHRDLGLPLLSAVENI